MTKKIVKYVLGEMASQDHSFISCVDLPDTCFHNKTSPAFKINEVSNIYNVMLFPPLDLHLRCATLADSTQQFSKAVMCPYPEKAPHLRCSLAHIHWHVDNVYLEKSPLAKGLATFSDKYGMNFDLDILLKEAMEHYDKFNNQVPRLAFSEWNSDFADIALGGFHLPVCIHPHGWSKDFTVTGSNNKAVPAICGDYRGDETKGFYNMLAITPGSELRTSVFRTETVPRVSLLLNTLL